MELRMEKVTKSFIDMNAVDCVSYTMGTGVYGLLGINGAGKTTLMRMLTTLIKPSSGKITYDGQDIFEMDGGYRRIIGYLPQDFGYYPEFTVMDYLLYIASIKGLKPGAAKRRAEALIKKVGLEKQKNKKMKKLSGGMRRRAGIAQAMLNDPEILILDEPTAGLDPNERVRFRNLLSEFSKDRLVLLSTHIVSDVEYIAKEILFMQNGKIEAAGTSDELLVTMTKKVWEVDCSREETEFFTRNYMVSNIKMERDRVLLRILSADPPTQNAVLEKANLEDLFLSYFGERSGADND